MRIHIIRKKASLALRRVILVVCVASAVVGMFSSCRPVSERIARVRVELSCRNATERSDFYRFVNREWLVEHAVIPDGYVMVTSFSEVQRQNDARLIELFDDLSRDSQSVPAEYAPLISMYRSACGLPETGGSDLAALKPFLRRYEDATSIAELVEADLAFHDDTGMSNLLQFEVFTNDDGTAVLYHMGPMPDPRNVYSSKGNAASYASYLARLFFLAGYDKTESARRSKLVIAYERELNARALGGQALIDPANARTYPYYLFRTYYPMVDLSALFQRMGLSTPDAVLNSQQGILERAAESFKESNLETLSAYAQARVLKTLGKYCSFECARAEDNLFTDVTGTRSAIDDAHYRKLLALGIVKELFPRELGYVFSDRFCSAKVKSDVAAIVRDVIRVYKDRLMDSDWLEPYTRERAIEKLDAIRVNVAYPDEWAPSAFDSPGAPTLRDDALLENWVSVCKLRRDEAVRAYAKKRDRKEWACRVYDANAFYSFSLNEVFLPAGILQPPFYDANSAYAANLGGIGVVIAHEISHAFDNNGAQFDSRGAPRKWWTLADYTRFKERCDKVAVFFDGIPVSPGVSNKGALTVSENVADLLGVECALELLREKGDPDYRPFFTSFATSFRSSMTDRIAAYCAANDVHSLGPVRVNRTLSAFKEFRETFGITPDDALYVADGEQVRIW